MYSLNSFPVRNLSSSSNSEKSKIHLHLTEFKKQSPPSLPKQFPSSCLFCSSGPSNVTLPRDSTTNATFWNTSLIIPSLCGLIPSLCKSPFLLGEHICHSIRAVSIHSEASIPDISQYVPYAKATTKHCLIFPHTLSTPHPSFPSQENSFTTWMMDWQDGSIGKMQT